MRLTSEGWGKSALRTFGALALGLAAWGLLGAVRHAEASVFPRASQQPDTTISYVNLEGDSLADVFMMTSLQGNVNRTKPQIYLVNGPVVDYNAHSNVKTGQYWLDKLTGYTKTEYTDKYEMIANFADSLDGCILYDGNIFDYTGVLKQFQPSDNALATMNFAAMLSSRYHALVLTEEQRETLIDDYGVTLPILFDTTTSDYDTWQEVYDYALENLAPYLRTDITAHDGHFFLADMDYIIAQGIFTYNRVLHPNPAQAADENEILELGGDNTPVIGAWHLQQDEAGLVTEVTGHGRFYTVTYETWNLSWTSGLPEATLTGRTPTSPAPVPDENKVYISFNVTEGDNTSFLYHTLPVRYDQTERGDYPIGFEMVNTLNELAPNMAAYYYGSRSNSSLITPASGVGYTNYLIPQAYRNDYLALTDDYMAAAHSTVVRTMWNDFGSALPYASLSHASGVLVGYRGAQMGGGEPTVDGAATSHLLYQGKPFLKNYDFAHMNDILSYEGPTPAFFSVSALGWNVSPAEIKDISDKLPANFEVVSPEDMIALYGAYYTPRFADVTEAAFKPLMTADEAGFLQAAQGSNVITASGLRYADGAGYWTYKFDLDDDAAAAWLQMDLANNYRVYASKDNATWTLVAAAASDVHDESNRSVVSADLSTLLAGNAGKTVYVRFTDGSTGDGWGPALRQLKLFTDKSQLRSHRMATNGDGEEAPFLYADSGSFVVNGTTRVADGTESFVYRFDLANDAVHAVATLDLYNNYRVYASADGVAWTPAAAAASDVHDGSNRADVNVDLSALLAVGNASKTVYLKFADGSTGDGWGAALSRLELFTDTGDIMDADFKTVGNGAETPYLLRDDGSYLVYGNQQGRRVADGGASFVYRFNLEDDAVRASAVMRLENNYRVYASADGAAWTLVAAAAADVHDGSNRADVNVDLTALLAGGNASKTIYLKFADGSPSDGWGAGLGRIAIVTDLSEASSVRFVPDGQGAEAPYLHADSGSGIYAGQARYADGTGYWVYRFDLDDATNRAHVLLDLANNYRVSASTDGSTWTSVLAAASDTHDLSNRGWRAVDLTAYATAGASRTVYLKFADGSTGDGWGPALFGLELYTDRSQLESAAWAANGDGREAAFLETQSGSYATGGDHRVADGNAYWIYKLDLQDAVKRLAVHLDMMNNYRVAASKDGTNWTVVAAAASDVHDGSNRGIVKLDLTNYLDLNDGGKTVYLKFYDGSPADGWGASLYRLELYTDRTQWSSFDLAADGSGDEIPFIEGDSTELSGGARITPYGKGITYRFDLDDRTNSFAPVLDIANNYVVYATADPTAAYTKVAEASSAVHDESNRQLLTVDLSAFLINNPSKTVYLYFGNADAEQDAVGGKLWSLTFNP
ncbi:GxGYxYP domain-containing protein [Cohnella sp. 56]|uniref:GxGYxYP domain-containing protein n=1 Tax=Cohnella sp. 56 TaxID=3113722 RepID=UPI0030EA2337